MANGLITLNWYGRKSRWTKGLRNLFQKNQKRGRRFVTIRLGHKWAKKLMRKLGFTVNISIGDDPNKTEVIGQACVVSVWHGFVRDLVYDPHVLKNNIGAKNWDQALDDIAEAYGLDKGVAGSMTLTVIELKTI